MFNITADYWNFLEKNHINKQIDGLLKQ